MRAVRLGQLLIESKFLHEPQLEAALAEQKRSGGKLGEVLVRMKLLSEEQLTLVLATQQGVGAVDLDGVTEVSPAALERIPADVAHAHQVVPLEFSEQERLLVVATADIPRGPKLETLRGICQAWVVPKLAGKAAITRALERFYGGVGAPPPPQRRPVAPEPTAPEIRALIDLLAERGILSWDEYLSRLRK